MTLRRTRFTHSDSTTWSRAYDMCLVGRRRLARSVQFNIQGTFSINEPCGLPEGMKGNLHTVYPDYQNADIDHV